MRYREYLVKPEGCAGLEKRLGVLGECHMYTAEETEFARKIVQRFDNVAVEAVEPTPFFVFLSILHIPFTNVYCSATNRSLNNNPSARTLAKLYGKRVFRLENAREFTTLDKVAITTGAMVELLAIPLAYIELKLRGDPFEEGTKAYEKTIKRDPRKSLLYKLYARNISERDRAMAETSFRILKAGSENLLSVCGETHFDGVTKNLEEMLELEEVNRANINPMILNN